jgi:hypothetical protein
MTLQPNAIDPDAIILQELDDVLACVGGLVAYGLDAVSFNCAETSGTAVTAAKT